jgi:thiol:disulfide interchange protein
MASAQARRWLAVLTYTGLRVLLLLAVWFLLQLFTPLRGWLSVAVALVISGLVSLFLLNRQRASMGLVVSSFFGGINARIDAATRAEDDDLDIEVLAESEPSTQREAVDQEHQSGSLENDDQSGTNRT